MPFRYAVVAALLALAAPAETTYPKPPQAVVDVLNAPATPSLSVSPAHTYAILAEPLRYPPIADLAEPHRMIV